MKLTDADLKMIRELAQINFLDFRVDPKKENLFLARCYSEAFLHFLNSKGFGICPLDVLKK